MTDGQMISPARYAASLAPTICAYCGAPADGSRRRGTSPLCGDCFANRTAAELDEGAA